MKKVSTLVKIIPVSVFILYCLFVSSGNTLKTLLLFDYQASLGYLQDQLQWIFTPSLERNRVMKVPEAYMSVVEIITQRGYPVEVHHVTTEDGYVLELHRIPFTSNTAEINSTRMRRPVFLQHGLAGSDHTFLINSIDNSLPFGLAERGYDVWLGNSRGNLFSRKHVKLDPNKDEEFWNYSWDEMARYDLPASIDYVLNVTGQRKLAGYFGYSLGCTLFFMHSSESTRLNEQVDIMVGLGPTASVANLGNYLKPMSAFVKPYQLFQRWFGIGEVHANHALLHTLARLISDISSIGEAFVRMWIVQIYGFSEDFQRADFYRLISHYPAGTSANSIIQLMQNYNSGESIEYFDYGKTENLIRYGTTHPPEYNLTRITTPVLLIYADSDPLAPPEDVAWLETKLGNLAGSIRVPVPAFSHGDFIWSSRASELVYEPAMDFLPSPYLDETAC